MMHSLVLAKDHLLPFLRKLAHGHRLVAPVRNSHGDTLFTEIRDLDSTEIDLENQPQDSLKRFFFPQAEVLSMYGLDREGDGRLRGYRFFPQLPENRPTVYFGVRSCDMMAVMYTDMIFLQTNGRDIYYARRRENAVFITLGCNRPFANCFCNATGSGPFLEYGYDLQLTDIGDDFFVEINRARGIQLGKKWRHFFRPATREDRKLQFQAALEARGLFRRLVHLDMVSRRLARPETLEHVFASLSARCQDCGGCAYICPTCTCFTIEDHALDGGRGERVRTWDACTFAGFTRMAGDHNPVDPERQRIRRRFLHKLYHDVKRHGRTSCMGCGRCVDMCFGGVDILRFITMVSEDEPEDRETS